MLASGPPAAVPGMLAQVAGVMLPDASQRMQQQVLPPPPPMVPPYLPRHMMGEQACQQPGHLFDQEDVDEELSAVLALLDPLRADLGPSVPPLPPSGCYGKLRVSSALAEGLGAEEAHAAQLATDNLGDRPVKVLLPWCPSTSI